MKSSGKELFETNSVKYLGSRIDCKLNWKVHIDNISLKLIRVNAMLYKVRDFVNAVFQKQFTIPYLSHIFIMCVLFGYRMYAQSIVYHTSKESINIDPF